MQLDISNNHLCGLDEFGRGTYSAEGINAIADALRVNASLTSLSMHSNKIGAVGGVAIADALRVNASLTSCNVLKNNLDVPAAKALVEAVKDKDVSLCGIRPDETSTGSRFVAEDLKPPDAILLASDLSKAGVSASMTEVLAFSKHVYSQTDKL